MNAWDIEKSIIFETLAGSKLYGTDNELSDTDLRGICIPPEKVLLNPFYGFEQKDSGFEQDDRTIYALGQFFKLAADANPNILELLWSPQQSWVKQTRAGVYLLENRDLFLSKKIKYTFTGYAFSQLKSIKNHRKWFLNPPKKKPERKHFGLSDAPLISGEGLESLSKVGLEYMKDEWQDVIRNEILYREAKRQWDNYVAWRDNRNPARKSLEEKYGYDCKYCSHIFRLLSEGKSLLLTGNIIFPLPEAGWLKEIKNGKYTYDEALGMAEELEQSFEQWYKESDLPNAPDRKKLEILYFELLGGWNG